MGGTTDTATRQAEIQSLFEAEQNEPPRLQDRSDVPGTPDVLTVDWLTDVLCRDCEGARVELVEHGTQYNGTTSGRRLRIRYNDAGRRAGLPERLFAKFSPTVQSRCLVGINGSSAGEVAFYNDIATTLPIEVPSCHYAGFEDRSCRIFLLLEDLVETRNARFGTALDLQIGQHQAESMVTLMATLHGAFWGEGSGPAYPYRTSVVYQEDFNETLGFEQLTMLGHDMALDVLPPALRDRREDWHGALMRSLELNTAATPTLLHQDTHLANWYALPDGSMGLADWQCVARGQWALDVAYALAIGLSTEDRRAWERDLISVYLHRLADAVPATPSFQEAWLAYRQQMFHAVAFWLAPFGIGEGGPVAADVSLVNIQRAAQAIDDLRSFDALDAG
jgi:Phosphotransferase enzyme family